MIFEAFVSTCAHGRREDPTNLGPNGVFQGGRRVAHGGQLPPDSLETKGVSSKHGAITFFFFSLRMAAALDRSTQLLLTGSMRASQRWTERERERGEERVGLMENCLPRTFSMVSVKSVRLGGEECRWRCKCSPQALVERRTACSGGDETKVGCTRGGLACRCCKRGCSVPHRHVGMRDRWSEPD